MLTQHLALCTVSVHHQLVRIDWIIEPLFVLNSMTLYIGCVMVMDDHLKLNRFFFCLHLIIIIIFIIIRDYVPVSVLF